MSLNQLVSEGQRQMQICNACRYCEGYCAVWKAMEHRREFTQKDLAYLANLCHDCRDCLFACPFAAPHEFGINPPKLFSELRQEMYRKYGWPNGLARVISKRHTGSFWVLAVVAMLLLFLIATVNHGTTAIFATHVGTGAFYRVISELVLVTVFGVLGLWLVAGWLLGAVRYWNDIKSINSERVTWQDIRTAVAYAAKLRYLGREGAEEEELAGNRKWLHHLVAYGFLLDLASTTLAAIYSHVFGIQAPYPVYHPVVVLGVLGGIGIIIGTSGLLYVKSKSYHQANDEEGKKSGNAFIISLLMIAVTGMLVLLCRDTAAMGTLLVFHLGTVAALFVTAPYSKFVHLVYRYLALVRYAQEERVAAEKSH